MLSYESRKRFERALPPFLYTPLRSMWRTVRESPEKKVIRLLCRRDEAAVDVGACEGHVASWLEKYSSRCFVFEPNPNLIPVLRSNLAGKRIEIIDCALSDREGRATLSAPITADGALAGLGTIESGNAAMIGNGVAFDVPKRRLDSFDLPKVACVKIDVEGHEMAVLRGASGLLDRDSPALLVEAENRHRDGAVGDVTEFLLARGYRGFFLMGRRIVDIARFDPLRHQNPVAIDGAVIRPGAIYLNMFVFAKDAAQVAALARG